MFATYNYFAQHNNNQPINDFKDFYRTFSNTREFGGDFTHYDHLVKNRFMDNFHYVYQAALRHQPEKILDVGCGNGVNLPISKMLPCEYHGLDYAEKSIEKAAAIYDKVHFHVGDAFHMKFEDASFDMVILSSVLILYEQAKDREALLKECLRVLKPDGVVVLIVWHAAPLFKLSLLLSRVIGKLRGEKLPCDFNGIHFSTQEIRSLCKTVGVHLKQTHLTSTAYGILESVRYLNFQKYRRTFGTGESEHKKHPQSVLADLQNSVVSLKWLVRLYDAIAKVWPSAFSFFSVNIIEKR